MENKKLLMVVYSLIAIILILYFTTILLTGYFMPEGVWQLIIILFSTILLFITVLLAVKIEQKIGYYECKNCKHRYVPTYKAVLLAMHMGTTRRLKCPKCEKKTWSKKVMTKE